MVEKMKYKTHIKWGTHEDDCEYFYTNAKNRSEAFYNTLKHITLTYSDMLRHRAQIMEITKEPTDE